MKAVITVLGKDTVGILAKVAAVCAEYSINVTDVSQTILEDIFAMLMMVDMAKSTIPLSQFSEKLKALGSEMGIVVYVVHSDVFESMHHI